MSSRWESLVAAARRFWQEVIDADLMSAAAAVAYSLVLAIFPALIFLSALAGHIGQLVGIGNLSNLILSVFGLALPPVALGAITDVLTDVMLVRSGELLSLGIIFAVWAASNGTAAMMKAFNRVHGVRETRPFWLHRIVIAIGLTVTLGFVLILSFVLLIFGAVLSDLAVVYLGLDEGVAYLWSLAIWPVSGLVILLSLDIFYWIGPNVRQRFRLITIGALLATVGWLCFSFGFRLFVGLFSNFPATYGAIAGVIILMLWLNYSALVVILGAKLNTFLAARVAPPSVAPPAGAATGPMLAPAQMPASPRVHRGPGKYGLGVLAVWTMVILVGALRGGGRSDDASFR